ncbi:tripartite tricarboxylate transporter substrate binding protein [Pusillimonas sp. ANT_WB101]|uniref:Bug family tripartite tricarboxylate transporter substrate binding protein n=1 Tax=Pusillimonas sp. ANT_WB101 TaxID=2597356 RepID=UPI0011F084F4|nr:tripartite tricarboxylate transporter substrate binding protein [Pusillimonas sp. ANT_WB101]KAA0892685.1 tripartite tricarboxylate transporter substrate binding protein [Pusillimonas sp. ANT_WB101]
MSSNNWNTRLRSACAILLLTTGAAHAAGFPTQPITLVLPFGNGGSLDTTARLLARGMQERLGQPVIVESKTGASGTIAINYVHRAKPDGYTLAVGTTNLFSYPQSVLPGRTYDPVADFEPISGLYRSDLAIIVPENSPIKTMADLVAAAKRDPGKLNYASYGVATTTHFCMEEFERRTGTSMTHVPYRTAPTLDVVAGRIDVSCDVITPIIPLLKSNRVRTLGVTAETRSSFLPDVPTVAEQGFPGFSVFTWSAVMAPKGTPPEVVRKLNETITAVIRTPEFQAQARSLSVEPWATSPQELADFIKKETTKWQQLVTEANIKLD